MFIPLFLALLSFFQSVQAYPKIILITLDGVRWQEVINGSENARSLTRHLAPEQLLPNLYASVLGQGIGIGKDTPIIASGANYISLVGYREITLGHPSFSCQTNYCDNPINDNSILQLSDNIAVFASWVGIKRVLPIGYKGYADIGKPYYRWDQKTEQAVKDYLAIHFQPDLLWVSLGDTDELAHQNDYGGYIRALQQEDVFIGDLVQQFPDAIFIITTDHGRSTSFRDHGTDKTSKRVWLMMRGQNIPHMGWVSADPLSLSNIYPTIEELSGSGHSGSSILDKIHLFPTPTP